MAPGLGLDADPGGATRVAYLPHDIAIELISVLADAV